MPYDILQGVKYDPRYDDQNFALIAQGLDEANKRYDIAEASISDALAQYGAIPAVKEDRPFLTKRLDQFSQDINEMVNKKYAGDYGAASKEIARRIKQEHPYFAAAKQTEEAYRQALPLYQKLQAEGKLVTRGGVNPLAKSTFDEQGNIVGTPTYEMYERGPYEDWIAKNYSQAFQNKVREEAPKFTGQSPYAIAKKLRGMTEQEIAQKITDVDAAKFLEDNKVFAIEYNLDPNKAEDLKAAKDYLVKTAQSQVATQIDNQYLKDESYMNPLELRRLSGSSGGYQLPMTNLYKINPGTSVENVRKEFTSLREGLNTYTPSDKPKPAWMPPTQIEVLEQRAKQGDASAQETLMRNKEILDKGKNVANESLKDLKSKYSLLWNNFGGDEGKFLDAVEGIEVNRSKLMESLTYHPDPEVQKYFTTGIEQSILRNVNLETNRLDENYNPKTNMFGGTKKYKQSDIGNVKDAVIDLMQGNIVAVNDKGEKYIVNKNVLSEPIEHYLDLSKQILDKAYNYNDDAFKPVKDNMLETFNGPDGSTYQGKATYVKNPSTGKIEKYMESASGEAYTMKGQPVVFGEYSPEELAMEMTNKIYSSINPYLKKTK